MFSCMLPTASRQLGAFPLCSPRRLGAGLMIANNYMSSLTTSQFRQQPFPIGTTLRGSSGQIYKIDGILSDRRSPRVMCVYSATAQGQKHVIKNILPDDFKDQMALQHSVSDCPNLRTVTDTIVRYQLFVYPYLHRNLIEFPPENFTQEEREQILKSALVGLAALHEKHIIHTDIKPNNIMLDLEKPAVEKCDKSPNTRRVQITDLEDAVDLGPRSSLKGCLSGNAFWRSPESWARARQNLPSDIFSFGIVAIYVMLDFMALYVNPDQLNGEEHWNAILKRQISYFADPEGLDGLLHHLGEDNAYFDRVRSLCREFGPENPMEPFRLWKPMDPEFKDVVCKMTNLDPTRRITAREALGHSWFRRIAC